MKRKLITLFGVMSLVFAISACQSIDSIDSIYGCGIHSWNSSNISDLGKVEKYITNQGGPWGTVIIHEGKSETANDATMKAQFDAAVSKMDFSTLNLDPSTSFVYSAVGSTSSPNEKGRVVASYKWPK